jgi:aryl-alcohol dehydrogenase-like predicted oxidoreductase
MNTITLGKSGLVVSRIAFGTWQLDGDWGLTDEIMVDAAPITGPSPETV